MSTTNEAADVDEYGHPATSISEEVSSLAITDEEECGECSLCPADVFCVSCKQTLCLTCDAEVVHNSRTTRNHKRMAVDDYLVVKCAMGSSSPTNDQIVADHKNKLCFIGPLDHRIYLQPRLASLVPDPNARPSLVSFIGPTGVGKSTLLRLLVSLDGEKDPGHMPLAGAPNDAQSTSADIHMYAGGQVPTHSWPQSAVTSTYPLLYVDSEGRGGSKDPGPIRLMWHSIRRVIPRQQQEYHNYQTSRLKHVQVSYPRMLYIFSDVLCFVFQGDWREKQSIVTPLLEWGRSASVGAANQHRPQLILIFNKTGEEALLREFEDFRETYKKWIAGDQNHGDKELRCYFSDPLVCLVPRNEIDTAAVFDRVKKLRDEIHYTSTCIRTSREQANQLFTRSQLQLYMQLAADTFSKNPNEEFDIYKAIMARRPTSGGLAGYITEFRRAVEQANMECKDKYERHRISLSILQMRIEPLVLLWNGRLDENLPCGANIPLPPHLQTALEKAQVEIDGELPCFATTDHGGQRCHCDRVQKMHALGAQHVSAHTKGARWIGSFLPNTHVQRASDACRLVHLAKRALQGTLTLSVKETRRRLSEVRRSERVEYPWMDPVPFYRVCVSCIIELPTEVLSCGHIICVKCAKEEADVRTPKKVIELECPVCLSSAKWYPKDLPPVAGYRILSLDGGGVRGIVELLLLEEIMSFFPDMHVEDLFDVIVGTSTGGIIALALAVHAPNGEPRRLQEVTQLYPAFCREVFSKEMLRNLAQYKLILRLFQLVRIYDTKYRNDNLLKLLKEYLGEQSLLRSCVRGPHVIVTSCERDNNLVAAWFTSYNRPMLETEDNDLPQHAHLEQTGRVRDNHLFSAKDAAAATSAAGTYFPAYEAYNRFWVDGGLRFNCPALVAIKEARTLWPERPASAIISLGCGLLEPDQKPPPLGSLISFLTGVVNIATDAESKFKEATDYLNVDQPDSSACTVRLNPTIKIPKGENCDLDNAEKMAFLMEKTKKYLRGKGRADVQMAANLLFAAFFYIASDIDQECHDRRLDLNSLSIRSRAAVPERLRIALSNAMLQTSLDRPFSVTVREAPAVNSVISWDRCTWEQGVMNLPFEIGGLPMVRPLTVVVELHTCLPGTPATGEWRLPISGMPCKLGALDW